MDKPRKIIRSPSAKRKSRPVPLNQRVSLERVIGLTVSSNATLATDPSTGNVAYPAGCVVVLFNPRKNRQTHIFNTSKKTITSISFSPDGKHIVTGESGHQPAVRVWDVEERSQVAEFHGHKFGIVCVKFSPNMKHIVSMGSQHDMMVNVWNWRTGTKVASNKVSSKVNSIAFSHDGSMFVTVGNRHVKFWYLEGSKSKIKNETVPLLGRSGILGEQKNNFFCDVAIVDNKTFVITQSGLLCQFNEKRNLEKWAELKTTAGNCISAGEEYIFVGCANGVVRVFDTQTLHYVTTLPHPHPLGVDVASAQSPSQMVCQNQDAKFPDTIALVFNDTFKKVTCVYNDHSLYMWDVHDVKRVGKSWSNLYHGSCVWGLEVGPATFDPSMLVLPPGSFITSSADDTIRIWNIDPHMKETKYYKQNVYSHELLKVMYVDPSFAYLRDVDYNPAGGTDKTDTNLESKNGIRCLGVSPDGHHLASGDRIGNVRIHDLRDQTELQNIEAHDQEVMSVQYSNIQTGPSLLASSGRDRLLHIYDVEQGYGTIQSLYDHSSTVTAIKFSDSENQLKLLSSSADKSVLFRNAQQSPEFQFVLGNQHVVGNNTLYDMDIDLAQKFLAVACQDRNIRVYDIKTAKQKKCYKGTVGDSGPLIRLQLDPSGQYAVTSSLDKNLCILDFTSGEILATMFGHSDAPTGVKFMNDLKHVVSVSGDSCIFVWRLPTEMTKQMQNKLEELGQLPLQAINTSVNNSFNMHEIDESLGRAPLFPNEQGFSSPSKILAQLQKKQEEKEREEARNSPDFRYSVGPLPKWAKAQLGEGNAKGPEGKAKHVPQGKWAKRVDRKSGPVIMSEQDQKARKFQLRDASPDTRRQTMVLSKPENTPRKVPMVSDDKDDDDDDVDAFKEEIIYPPSENGTDTDDCMFTVFTGKEDTTRRTRQGSIGRNVDAESSSTDPVSLDDVEEEEEIPSAPVTPCDDDVTLKASGREKYLREQYENLNFSPTPMDKFEKGLDKMEQSMEDNQPSMFSTRASISSKFLSKAQQANIRNMSVYGSVQRQDNWFDSVQRRKDEMARAVDETRKRLMAMGWKDESPESPPSNTSPGSTSPTNKVGKKESVPGNKVSPRNTPAPLSIPQSPPGPHTPKSLRRCWSTFDLPKQPIIEEKANMNLNYSKSNPSTPVSRRSGKPASGTSKLSTVPTSVERGTADRGTTRWRSKIPAPPACNSRTASPQTLSSVTIKKRTRIQKRVSVWDKPMESDSEESTSSNPRKSATRQSRPTTLSVSNRRKQDTKETKPESRYPLRSQSQGSLYRRSTESSKAKTSKTGPVTTPTDNKKPLMKSRSITNVTNLSKSNSTQNLASKTSSEKPKAPPRSSKLKPTAKSTFYSSTPNLAGLDDTDDEDFTVSNLRLCADISLSSSTPDLLDDDTVSVESQSTDSEREKPSSGRRIQPDPKRFSTGTPSRVSAQRTDARKSLPGRKLLSHATASDRDLMPPPSSTSVLKTKGDSSVVKSKQEIFLKRAMQTRKRTTFELTFDQAKEILKGKSGILTGESSSFEKTKTTSTVSYSTSNSTTTTSCSHSTSVSPSISSSVTTYSSVTPKRNIPKVTSPPIHLTPNQIMIESEIDSTAAEIRRQNMIDSAFQNLASLEAYPDDIPERDYNPSTSSYISPSLPSVSNTSSSTNIQQNYQLKEARTLPTHHRHSPPSHIDTDENDSDTPSKSVRERIAQLNAHNSPRSSEQRRGQPSSSQVTYGPGQGTMQASPGSASSPRSSGVGSSLDSEMAAKAFAGLSPPSDSDDVENSDTGNTKCNLDDALGAVTNTYSSPLRQRHLPQPVWTTSSSGKSESPDSSSHSTIVTSPREVDRQTDHSSPRLRSTSSPRRTDALTDSLESVKQLEQAISNFSLEYNQAYTEDNPENLKMRVKLKEAFTEATENLRLQMERDFNTDSVKISSNSNSSESVLNKIQMYNDSLLGKIETIMQKHIETRLEKLENSVSEIKSATYTLVEKQEQMEARIEKQEQIEARIENIVDRRVEEILSNKFY